MNPKYINQLSVLSMMMIQKNQEISLALKEHKSREEIGELKTELMDIHRKIREARLKIKN